MIKVVRHPEGKKRPHNAPWYTLYPRRVLSLLTQDARYRWRTARTRWEARRSIVPNRSWRRFRPSFTWLVHAYAIVGTLALLLWIEEAIRDTPGFTKLQKEQWFQTVSRFVGPFLVTAFVLGLFLIFWYRKTKKPVVEKARKDPHDLVPTSGTIVDQVVGREELAQVIAETLRDRRTRKPYLLIGGVGAGKTAVLVELTQLLAEQSAVPVPIQLRDSAMDGELNFEQLAKRRFMELADQSVLSSAQAERTWRQLRLDDKVVVIADGLEEAVQDEQHRDDRDNIIRRAIDRACRQELPLVIASRPHAPLESAPAAIMELEPLSEEAALEFLLKNTAEVDERRLDWIVETANVAQSPIYMQIARMLQQHGCLQHLALRRHPDRLDTRSHDCSGLRLLLLETWRQALVEGRLKEEVVMAPEERQRTVEVIAGLACVGLLQDSLEVTFDEFTRHGEPPAAGGGQRESCPAVSPRQLETIRKQVCARIGANGEEMRKEAYRCHKELARYAAFGQQLGLTMSYENKVRFPHSIIQAYLGFHLLRGMPDRQARGLIGPALQSPGPGRELLIALVLLSRNRAGCRLAGEEQQCAYWSGAREMANLLRDVADDRHDAKSLDLYTAALEISAMAADPSETARIAGRSRRNGADGLVRKWPEIHDDRRTLDEAKLQLVRRYGELLRESEKRGRAPDYHALFEIGRREGSHAIRLAIAQELGAGGDDAYRALIERYHPGQDPVEQFLLERQRLEDRRDKLYADLLKTSRDSRVRELHGRIARTNEEKEDLWREFIMRAWMVPMLVGSVSERYRDEAKERLDYWLRHLDPAHGTPDLPLSLESALAQGFKSAANRRRRHANVSEKTRTYLVKQAEKMLSRSRYWFAQLNLLQALCLWALPDTIGQGGGDGAGERHRGHRAAADGQDHAVRGVTDPGQSVAHWLSLIGSEHPAAAGQGGQEQVIHPFVAEAGDLVTLALETGHPEHFVWIDEKGAIGNVGSRPADPERYRKHNLWIAPSVGWSILHPRAQRLIADVLIMLNLTQRDGKFDEVEERLKLAGQEALPPCLTRDRSPLHPEFTVGRAEADEPGSMCLANCRFRLCPYPPRGRQPRSEIEEPFCRQQQALLHPQSHLRLFAVNRHTPPWVGTPVRKLHGFWETMADRTRATAGRR
ncbi:NACHT domain-containing protein [Streptomyces orinoci]|uniref:ATP-binding protein n=1 Tax=Streptomyces orinoci TaxID=67339 RepID=A0ABV3K2C4_STRON|nr:ATP-binding protein [Streptomyces orinoci]